MPEPEATSTRVTMPVGTLMLPGLAMVTVRLIAWLVVDGLGPYNPALAISNYPDLNDWLAEYREVGRTRGTIIYRRK